MKLKHLRVTMNITGLQNEQHNFKILTTRDNVNGRTIKLSLIVINILILNI